MQIVKLRKVGNSATVTLPASVVEALDLHENDEIAVEVAGDRIVLTRATSAFQDAWSSYQLIEPRYRNPNLNVVEQALCFVSFQKHSSWLFMTIKIACSVSPTLF